MTGETEPPGAADWRSEALQVPAWIERLAKNGDDDRSWQFREIAVYEMRARYLDLRDDFRSALRAGDGEDYFDEACAAQVSAHLTMARRILEDEKRADGRAAGEAAWLTGAKLLSSAERGLVRIYSCDMLDIRWWRFAASARAIGNESMTAIADALRAVMEHDAPTVGGASRDYVAVRQWCATIQDAVAEQLDERIAAGAIQRRRLKGLRRASFLSLFMLLAAAPLVLPRLRADAGSVALILSSSPLWNSYLSFVAVGVFGAVGGFLSTLLQVQRTRVSLMEYQENKYSLHLRPVVGTVLAMLSFALLSWGVVPGVQIAGAGTYFLVALASGFSERYFLRILSLGDDERPASASTQAAG